MTRQQASAKLDAVMAEWQRANDADGYAKAVCRRLTQSEAAASFAAVCSNDEQWKLLLAACITGERISRTLRHVVAMAIDRIESAERAAADLESVRQFLSGYEIAPGLPDPIADAFNLLGSMIYTSRIAAQRVISERSRKTDRAAQRSAGMAWIKEAVKRLSGAPNLEHVVVLAAAALGGEVTYDSVRKAVMPSDAAMTGYATSKSRLAHSIPRQLPE